MMHWNKRLTALLLALLMACVSLCALAEEPVEEPVVVEVPAEEVPAEEVPAEEPADEQPVEGELIWSAEDELDPNRRIEVYVSWEGEYLELGDRVTLNAVLYGYENTEYTLQWQSSPDGAAWSNVPGANQKGLSFTLTAENMNNFWRILVHVTGVYVAE